jgi:SulP family sulfate permease
MAMKSETKQAELADKKPTGLGALWPHFPLLATKNTTHTGELETISKVFKDNIYSGCTIALISLPLSASLAVASNVNPMVGIETSFWSGLIMSVFGSSDHNVVGCSGALSGMITSYTVEWSPDVVPYLALVSGCFLALFRLFRLDRYIFHMPSAVFEGFSCAVALIIGLNQLNFAFGLHPHHKHKHFYENVWESLKLLPEFHGSSAVYTIINTILLLALLKSPPKDCGKVRKAISMVPWIPVSAFVGVVLGLLTDPESGAMPLGDVAHPTIPTLYTKYGVLEPKFVRELKPFNEVVSTNMSGFIMSALFIAIVCALETVLAAKVAKSKTDHDFDEPQELSAVTLSHFVLGVTGCLPNTGLFLRMNANVQAGATHRMSQFIHAILVGAIAMLTATQFSYLPQPSAASILIAGSFRMVPYGLLAKWFREDKGRLGLIFVTTLVCVFEDPVVGLAVGVFLAYMIDATKFVGSELLSLTETETGEKRLMVNGPIAYTHVEKLGLLFKQVKGEKMETLVVDLIACPYVDWDGAAALEKGIASIDPCDVQVVNASAPVKASLEKIPGLKAKMLATQKPAVVPASFPTGEDVAPLSPGYQL